MAAILRAVPHRRWLSGLASSGTLTDCLERLGGRPDLLPCFAYSRQVRPQLLRRLLRLSKLGACSLKPLLQVAVGRETRITGLTVLFNLGDELLVCGVTLSLLHLSLFEQSLLGAFCRAQPAAPPQFAALRLKGLCRLTAWAPFFALQ